MIEEKKKREAEQWQIIRDQGLKSKKDVSAGNFFNTP